MRLVKRVLDFLNKDISELFRKREEYQIWGFTGEDGKREARKVYSDGRVISYEPAIYVA